MILIILIIAALFPINDAFGPLPKPYYTVVGFNVFSINQDLDAVHGYPKCDILNDAIKRLQKYIFKTVYVDYNGPISGIINTIKVTIKAGCVEDSKHLMWPSESMNESYAINVNKDGVTVIAEEIWGALRALETLFQLTYRNYVGTLCINETIIYDKPRFSFRGFMLDTSRHFLPVENILINLEAMALSKFNVFHWHIVDDESFPYQSRAYPDLSRKGSFHRYTEVYTQKDVLRVLDFSRRRGIRVIPEYDSPGHSQSWGKGQPNLLTSCYTGSKPNGNYGPINPILDSTYEFLQNLFQEVLQVFPDNYVHLGGDEVSFGCWSSNPYVVNFTKKMGFPNDFKKLQGFYETQLLNLIKNLPTTKKAINTMVWQEVFDNGNQIDRNMAIIHVWKGGNQWQNTMTSVTNSGYKAVLSSCWYLNYIVYGVDWPSLYKCDPQNFNGSNKDLVIGGEACMWSEYVDKTNAVARSWPRASVVAERLWSTQDTTDVNDMANRLQTFRCRLVINGIQAETTDSGGTYCNEPGHI